MLYSGLVVLLRQQINAAGIQHTNFSAKPDNPFHLDNHFLNQVVPDHPNPLSNMLFTS